jgi:hypothetical protein
MLSAAILASRCITISFHKTLHATPAMAANVTKRLSEMNDIEDVLEAWENAQR